MAAIGSLIAELRRRRVFRGVALYIVAAWIAIQVASEALPALGISGLAMRYVWLVAIAGFPIAVVFFWRYEFDDGRLVRTLPSSADEDVDLSLHASDYLILTLLLVVSSIAVWTAIEGISVTQHQPADVTEVIRAPENSIVVLPFRTVVESDADGWFREGLTEELSYSLTRLPQLRVTANRSAFAVAELRLDMREIGERLRVRYILDGSVRRTDERVRVNVELVESVSGSRVWQAEFDEKLADLVSMQTEIAGSILTALKVPLDDHELIADSAVAKPLPEAYDYYLLGLNEIRRTESRESFADWVDRAIEYFELAIAADPAFADAHAALARSHLYMLWSARAEQLESSTTIARQHIDQALALDSESEMAYLAMARIRHNAFDIDGYVRALERVLEINPANFEALSLLGQIYWSEGKVDKARHMVRAAYLRDPLSSQMVVANADMDAKLGNYDKAKSQFEELLETDSSNAIDNLITMEVSYGHLDEAVRWASILHQQSPDTLSRLMMARTARLLGAYDYAEEWLQTIDPAARGLTISAEMLLYVSSGRYAELEGLADMLLGRFVPETDDRLTPIQSQVLMRVALVNAVMGKFERSLSQFRRLDPNYRRSLDPGSRLLVLATMMTLAKKTGEHSAAQEYSDTADDLLRAIETSLAAQYSEFSLARAEWHAASGDTNAALRSLDDAFAHGFREATRIRRAVPWIDLQQHPRIIDIAARMDADVALQKQRALDNRWLRPPH